MSNAILKDVSGNLLHIDPTNLVDNLPIVDVTGDSATLYAANYYDFGTRALTEHGTGAVEEITISLGNSSNNVLVYNFQVSVKEDYIYLNCPLSVCWEEAEGITVTNTPGRLQLAAGYIYRYTISIINFFFNITIEIIKHNSRIFI